MPSTRAPHIFFNSSPVNSPEVWRAALTRQLGDLRFTVGPDCADPDTVDVALVLRPPPQGLAAFAQLRAVIALSAGVNQFSADMLPAGVPLSRAVDPSLAEHMVSYAKAAVYRYHRRFDLFERQSRAGVWRFEAAKLNRETTIGLLGLGELGSAIALALVADGFSVEGWSRSPRTLDGVRTHAGDAGLQAMLPRMDLLINVLPLTEATTGILSSALFARCREGACIVNMGRGRHLVEDDLLSALASGRIAAATLDVTQVEPLPADHAFWGHPGVLITPHVAGIIQPESAAQQVAENIRRAMRGEALLNRVDLAKGY
ncbi:MAG: Glyoxylate/hydroxypyruvate reductase [Rhodoferax sp.]|nr:Glyoxylate/hydroxypyruvate reductase [Rhodoferax sp.]